MERAITTSPRFVATAWLGGNVILGAESTSGKRGAGGQFHPVTVHWKAPGGGVGWIRLYSSPPVDAEASKDRITISCPAGDSVFWIKVPGARAESIARDLWKLPGLNVAVETDAKDFEVADRGDRIEVQYRGATKFALRTESNL